MADFNIGMPELGGGSPFQPLAPVQDNSAATALGGVANIVTTGMNAFAQRRARESQAAGDSFIQEFREKQLNIADAVSQGRMTSAQATDWMRNNVREYQNANPSLAGDIEAAHKSIVQTAGMGKVAVEGTADEQRLERLLDDGVAANWVDPTAPRDEQFVQLNDFIAMNRASETLAQEQAMASLQSTRIGIASSELALEESRERRESRQALVSLSSAHTNRIRRVSDNIIQGLNTGEIENPDQAMQILRREMSEVESWLSQVGADAGGEYLNNLAKPLRTIAENTEKYIAGQESLEWLQTQNRRQVALVQSEMLSSPRLARIAGASDLFPNSDVVGMVHRLAPLVDFIEHGTLGVRMNSFQQTEEGRESFREYTGNFLQGAMRQFSQGTLDELSSQELHNHVSGLIEGIPGYSGLMTEASDAQDLVNFLASPAFGAYVESAGGIPTTDQGQSAYRIMQDNYENSVRDLIRKEWRDVTMELETALRVSPVEASAGVRRTQRTGINVQEVVRPVFQGGGVIFVPSENAPRAVEGVDTIHPQLRASVRKLNDEVAPVLNKLIRMGAHFSGNRNYGQQFNSNYSDIFQAEPEELDVTESSGD